MENRSDKAGELDSSFGAGGIALPERAGIFSGMTTDRHNRIYAAGRSTDDQFYVARLTPEGQLDSKLNGVGYIYGSFGESSKSQAYTVNVDDKDRILIVGDQYNFFGPVCIARFTTDGKPDTTFGINGEVVLTLPTSSKKSTAKDYEFDSDSSQSNACTVTSDGKIFSAERAMDLIPFSSDLQKLGNWTQHSTAAVMLKSVTWVKTYTQAH
ncbi:hypothetical protein J3Q09_15960 [Pseudomonas sp. R4-83]|uniref:hypothetical protein n=1 Tax=unclassified Pseudomonas TaxID=196821 RepID=UPI003DA8B1E4